ncbi:LLM class flavin-dependent oxidoreductase [Nakamurella leprariae]|uniref:LLM class flavin-dependent oxidoreductase n=1 Tax=Nakamurella leprariae TaxID=2803911 RepID=A0A939C063_9ACTN|nr:LLM class flavin-dependent oxidoreductase [Nakamurella leprariae]MBM9465669.1 LLM class flavin-dependent oxidoreductase [Nakamurella leprariae]
MTALAVDLDRRPDTGAAYDVVAQVHLGVFYTGVGPQLVWSDPDGLDHTAVSTYLRIVQLLERGLFDAFFLGDGQRVRENRGRIHDLDPSGRPDAITQLSALASVTHRIGLVATQNATYNHPAELSRRLAGLDLLSGGRAGWNIVTTDNAWTGANFRAGAWLPHERRYERAAAFAATATALWQSWGADVPVEAHSELVRTTARATVPPSPQGRPVLFQSGDSSGGRDLAAAHADVVYSLNTEFDSAVSYAKDLRTRLRACGRSVDSVRILPGATVILGATEAEATDKARWVLEQQMSPPRALAFFEQFWGTDLSGYDPHGPLPDIEPSPDELDPSRGTITPERRTGKTALIASWRAMAAERRLSIVQLAREVGTRRAPFVGTPGRVADQFAHYVRTRAADGFNLGPHTIPSSLEDVVNLLVPELQERGVYRSAYTGSTLREHLALPAPAGAAS